MPERRAACGERCSRHGLDAQGNNWPQDKAVLQAFGEQFDTSWALYEKLEADAGGGTKLTWNQMGYDWSCTRTKGGLHCDPDLRFDEGPVSAKLTAEGQSAVDAKLAQLKRTRGEYDPIGRIDERRRTRPCGPLACHGLASLRWIDATTLSVRGRRPSLRTSANRTELHPSNAFRAWSS